MALKHILFDLDNTLYSCSAGLFSEIAQRMTEYLAKLLGLSYEAAWAKREHYVDKYGTTLNGLITEEGFDQPEDFITKVHPENVKDFLIAIPGIRQALNKILLPKSVFTNSSKEYATNVLKALELEELFDNIFDIRFCNYKGKPELVAYKKVVSFLASKPSELLLVDDVPSYLLAFKKLGGHIVLIDEKEEKKKFGFPRLKSVVELEGYLKRNFS